MIGEECVLEFFLGLQSRGQGLDSQGQGQDQGLKIVLEDPRGRRLVLEDSNTVCHNCFENDRMLGVYSDCLRRCFSTRTTGL